jgi:hypothetical protein
MADIQRGLVPLLIDLDRRARPGRPPRNRPLQFYENVDDTIAFSSDSVTVTITTGSTVVYYWHPATSTSESIVWGLFQWSS